MMKFINNYFTKHFLLLICVIFPVVISYAQDTIVVQDDLITNIFNYGQLINGQTTETTPKKSFELRIQHRFGTLDVKDFGNTVVQEFLGFDGSANIRFGFSFGLTDRLQIGIGRTKIDKVFDFEGKYRLLRQKEETTPISMSLYFNVGIASTDFPEVGPNEFLADSETPFEHKFAHRVSYNTQLLFSKKVGEKLSIELNPTFIYNNLVPEGFKNVTLATGVGLRFKTGITSSILFEYAAKFNNKNGNYKNPISIGYEMGTSGHAFQIIVGTTNQIIEQYVYSKEPLDYTDNQFLIGFNIKRTFWNGNK